MISKIVAQPCTLLHSGRGGNRGCTVHGLRHDEGNTPNATKSDNTTTEHSILNCETRGCSAHRDDGFEMFTSVARTWVLL